MIYAALAGVSIVGLAAVYAAWDFGRRWLVSSGVNDRHRHRLDEVVADLARLTDEHGERLDELKGKYGDVGTQLNLRVRALSDRLDKLETTPAEAPDVTKFNRALENMWREMREEFPKRATHEELAALEKRLNAVMSGAVAKGHRLS